MLKGESFPLLTSNTVRVKAADVEIKGTLSTRTRLLQAQAIGLWRLAFA